MEISQDNEKLITRAPAKLNLFLEVLRKRPDGYHDIETVMQTISLYDELTLEAAESEIRLVTDSAEIPRDSENLVVKAAELLSNHTGRALGATLHLHKNIPVSAGLGGGSSDAAAALVGLNRLWALELGRDVLHDLAAELGSDVPFFLYGGTAVCRGRGERVTPLADVPPMTYVVVCPPLTVSTREVYENLPPPHLTHSAASKPLPPERGPRRRSGSTLSNKPRPLGRGVEGLTNDLRDIKLFLEQLIKEGKSGTPPQCFNRLAGVTLERHESLRLLARRMTESGLAGVTMTGSGSAFFGIATSRKEASDSAEKLTRMDVGRIFVAESIP